MVRVCSGPATVTSAFRASSMIDISPMGDALTMFPPMVAMFLIGSEATSRMEEEKS